MRNVYKEEDLNEKYEKNDDVFVDLHPERKGLIKLISVVVVLGVALVIFNFCKYVFENAPLLDDYYSENVTNKLSDGYISTHEILNGEFDLYAIDEIFIDVHSSNLEVKKSDMSDTIKLEIFADEEGAIDAYYNCDEDGWGTINITSDDSVYSWNLEGKTPVIKLYVPETYDGEFFINLPFGNVNIGDFEYSSISLMSDAGDVSIEKAENLSANLSYGNIYVGQTKTMYGLCDYGNIEVGEVDSFCSMDVNYGNIKIQNLNIDSESDLCVNCGNIEIENTSDINIDASSSLGDVSVANSNAGSLIKLSAIVDTGDIKIK